MTGFLAGNMDVQRAGRGRNYSARAWFLSGNTGKGQREAVLSWRLQLWSMGQGAVLRHNSAERGFAYSDAVSEG